MEEKKQITTERCEKNEDLVETGRTGLDRVQSKRQWGDKCSQNVLHTCMKLSNNMN